MSETPLNVEIDDPENYSSSERLKHIYDARRQVREMRTEAAKHRESHPNGAVTHYRTGVESYLLEVDTLMRKHAPGPELLNNKHFGTVIIHPPGNWEPKRNGSYFEEPELGQGVMNLKVESIPEPKRVEMVGLMSLFRHPSPLQHRFEFSRLNSAINSGTVTYTGKSHIDWHILNRMVSSINDFLSDLGLGLDVDEAKEWKI